MRNATSAAAPGTDRRLVQVLTTTRSTLLGSTPAVASALPVAATAMSAMDSSSAKCRVAIPDRVRIHSSVDSIGPETSSLPTTRVGRYVPSPAIRDPADVGL